LEKNTNLHENMILVYNHFIEKINGFNKVAMHIVQNSYLSHVVIYIANYNYVSYVYL
jgi:hypothetical protein